MARIQYSGLVTSIRGSVGGTTFQKNGFGYSVKNKPKMVLPLSVSQELTKLIMRKATGYWRVLSSAERTAWNNYASTYPQYSKHNPSVAISGYTLFVMWTFQYLLATFVDNSPMLEPSLYLPELPVCSWHLYKPDADHLVLQSGFVPSSEDWNCNVYMSNSVPASVNFISSKYRFSAYFTSAIPNQDITASFISQFGKLPNVGDRIGIRWVLYGVFCGRVAAALNSLVTVSDSPI